MTLTWYCNFKSQKITVPANVRYTTELTGWHCYNGHSLAELYQRLPSGKIFSLFQVDAQYNVLLSKHTPSEQIQRVNSAHRTKGMNFSSSASKICKSCITGSPPYNFLFNFISHVTLKMGRVYTSVCVCVYAVSYTHLTLPTRRTV